MSLIKKAPAVLKWIFSVLLFFLLVMTVFRLVFFYHYKPIGQNFSIQLFTLGLRFDLRAIGILGLAMMLISFIPFLNPFKNYSSKKTWNFLLPLCFTILLLFYGIDYYHYDYLHQRLNASVLNYLEDVSISFHMMWQTYPLIKIFIGIIILVVGIRVLFGWLLKKQQQTHSKDGKKRILFYVVTFLLFALAIFGKIGQYPLRWSDAFSLHDDFKANVVLNPFQSFFSTLSFKNSTYDIKKVRKSYNEIADYLGVKNKDSLQLNFERNFSFSDSLVNKPNIVLVICESFSAYKSSMYGNPLNTTPYFNELCKNGLFYDRCFSPAYGTARGVWATITGIPDVQSPKTASRNPAAVGQRTIINDFIGYDKFYFIGGSATWANIQGLLVNNIQSLHLYEQDDYAAPKIDVWGVSDKNLFLEANKILSKLQSPFFAIIQTADNHRPYTIPKEDKEEFKILNSPLDTLKKYGFGNNDEYNAFRYTDFCFQKFIEAAKQSPYFDNTIFVFIGDHGIRGDARNMLPKVWTEKGLTAEHIPLLFYAPKIIKPLKDNQICSQIDVLPTIASLAKISYSNSTFGRNLLDTTFSANKKYAFIIDHDAKTIGIISPEYYFVKNIQDENGGIWPMGNNENIIMDEKNIFIKEKLKWFTNAYYETSKYLLLNNKKKR